MRSSLLVLLFVGIAAANVIQPVEKAVPPLSAVVMKGLICHTCHDIVADGENIGAAYNTAWLDSAIRMRCDSLHGIAHDCKKHFHGMETTIDQKIVAKEEPQYACVDINFCA